MHDTKSILVVDDSKTMTAIVSKFLHDAGFSVVECAHDGVSAIAKLRQKHYDLVITDWIMEPITGPALVKFIRADSDLAHVKTILLTSLQNKDDEAWLDGADGYVTKPFEPVDLIAKVDEVLSGAVPAVLLTESN